MGQIHLGPKHKIQQLKSYQQAPEENITQYTGPTINIAPSAPIIEHIYLEKIVEIPVEKIIYKDKVVYVDNPIYIDKPVEVNKYVEVEKQVVKYIDRIVSREVFPFWAKALVSVSSLLVVVCLVKLIF